jgi:fumarate hydratase class I
MANDTTAQSYSPLFPLGADTTDYEKLTGDHVASATFEGQELLKVAPEGLRLLAERAFIDINHLLRPGHLQQLRNIHVPGHRHRHRARQERPPGLDRG